MVGVAGGSSPKDMLCAARTILAPLDVVAPAPLRAGIRFSETKALAATGAGTGVAGGAEGVLARGAAATGATGSVGVEGTAGLEGA